MAASLKYFGLRLVNAVIVLFVVIFIISAAFSTMADQQLKTQIGEEIKQERMAKSDQMATWDDNKTERWTENKRENLSEKYGLNDPLWERIVDRTLSTIMLDFGESFDMTASDGSGSSEVLDIIWAVLPRTILLFTTAAFFYVSLGLIVGLKTAQVAGTNLDKFLSLFAMTTRSMPMWWLGMIAILIFSFELGWFPASAYPFPTTSGLDYYLGVLWRMILPLSVITFNLFGGRAWATRNIVTDVLQDDYIMAARAKGVPERKVIYGHTLKTAAPPVVTSAILTFFLSIGGAMITEIIFGWPGMGRLYYTAVFNKKDVPVVIGLVFINTFMFVFGYVVADMIYGLLDPRVEVGADTAMG